MNPFSTFYAENKAKRYHPLEPSKDKKAKGKSIMKLPSVKQPIPTDNSKYTFTELLGEGAFSKVYLSKCKSDGRKCVIKVYEKSRMTTEERKKCLKRELEALSIKKHVNIINAFDNYEDSENIGIVMEYFSKTSLREFAQKNRPIDNSTLQKITMQICQGLKHLHSFGMSHRDIKPENILINKDHHIKIIDLGFSTNQEQDVVVVAGTPQYMAPELIAKKNYDPLKADIWALGVMLYWLATGFFPQESDAKKKKSNKKIDSEFSFPADIHPGLEYLLKKILRSNPKERIDLAEILEDTWIKPKSLKAEIDRLRMSKNAPTLIQFY